MPRTSFHNALIVTMDAGRRVLTHHVLIINEGRITKIQPAAEWKASPSAEIVDLKGRSILPGLVNSPVHTVQHLGRGLSDDVDILTWLHKRIWPYEPTFSK